MAIQFTSDKAPKEESVDDILDKAMANLQKFSAPILKITQAHPSKTTTTETHDPAKGIELEHELTKDIPSFGETLLGGVAGAVSGFMSGGNFTTDAENPGGTDLGKAIGATVGGFLGSASYSGGREAGKIGQQAIGTIAGISQTYKASEQQKMASDAVGSATQAMSELNNPGNDPAKAAENAAKREQITSQLATNLVQAGMAPDKAISTAQNISAINSPNSKDAQDPGLQAQRAIAQYNASDKTQADKDKLKGTLNGIIMGQSIKLGKMPANASALLFGAGGGGSASASSGGGGGKSLTVEPVDENGNVTGPPIAVGAGSGGGAARAPSPSSGSSGGSAFDYNGDAEGIVEDGSGDESDSGGDIQYSNASDAKSAQVSKSALGNIDKLNQMIDSGAALPQGAIDGKEWDINKKGIGVSGGLTGGATGGAAAGAALGSVIPGLGTAIGGGVGAIVGGVGGALTGQSLGKGTSLGIPDEEKHDYTEFSTIAAALSQQLSVALGGRMTPEMHAMLDTVASPYSSNDERKVALDTLKQIISENASTIGANRAPAKGKATKSKQPGLFFFN